MAHADVLDPRQLLPLDVVVEVARHVREREVDTKRVFKHLEGGTPGSDAEAAELRAVLQVADGGPAGGTLAEIDLIGLHLAVEVERRFAGVVLFLFVGCINECFETPFDERQSLRHRFITRAFRVARRRRSPLGTHGLDLTLEAPDVGLQLSDPGRWSGHLLGDHRHLADRRHGARQAPCADRRTRSGDRSMHGDPDHDDSAPAQSVADGGRAARTWRTATQSLLSAQSAQSDEPAQLATPPSSA
ncbi:MAG: hypothetical protein ACKOTB_09800, partial [Planctomycetia bacterium]